MTVLLVEDEPLVANMVATALKMWGYQPLHAATAGEAIELAAVHGDQIAFVICDVVLPEMPGPVVAASIRARCPHAKICFTSGYTADVLAERGLLHEDELRNESTMYLQKPFRPQALRDLIARSSAKPATDQALEGVLYAAAC